MIRRAVVAALLAVLPAQGAPAAERWEIEIVGPATVEHGEMRFEGAAGRIVLESADSIFLPLAQLVRTDSSITFSITSSKRRFDGVVAGGKMAGSMLDFDGSLFTWNAQPIAANARRWPVPPRLTIRQLETGTDMAQVVVPGAWRAVLPDTARLAAEYDTVARAAGFGPWRGRELLARSEQVQLGLDPSVHGAMRRVLEGIEKSPAGELGFKALFRGSRGLRVDLHDMALEVALRLRPGFHLDQAMGPIWLLAPRSTPPLDSAAVMEVAWRFWSRFRSDSQFALRLDSLEADHPAEVANVRVLMRGYDDASGWWLKAVNWLMTEPWIATPDGAKSPSQLVTTFWGGARLPLPDISVGHYGAPEAFPTPSITPIIDRLIKPANAVAGDWIRADQDDPLDAWRTLDWGEPFRVIARGRSRYLTSPAVEARTHGGDLLEGLERIRIEPGIPPVLAVATLVHEWQHLILTGRRLRGTAPGVRENADEVRLLEEDPWLAEGAAEWATDVILAPCRQQAPLLLAISQARRLALQERTSDDPHALGYRLVRSAARGRAPGLVQSRLVALLHDLGGFARASGLAGRSPLSPLRLVRPVNAAVIPEVTFVFDGGAALDVHRRLRVSLPPLEH
jgi:hypothetical protein